MSNIIKLVILLTAILSIIKPNKCFEIIEEEKQLTDPESGRTVSMIDDLLVVGAAQPQAEGFQMGAVYVYKKYNNINYTINNTIKLSVGIEGDNFGVSLSITKSSYNNNLYYIIIGAEGIGNATGAAYIYSRDFSIINSDWSLDGNKILSPNPGIAKLFGRLV